MTFGERRLPIHELTWSALLGHWVDFARSAVALPDTEEGRAMRESVPDVIMLQAVWLALDQLDQLPTDQRRLGVDRAGVLIDRHAGRLRRRWGARPMPPLMTELVSDAQGRLDRRRASMDEPTGGGPGR